MFGNSVQCAAFFATPITFWVVAKSVAKVAIFTPMAATARKICLTVFNPRPPELEINILDVFVGACCTLLTSTPATECISSIFKENGTTIMLGLGGLTGLAIQVLEMRRNRQRA